MEPERYSAEDFLDRVRQYAQPEPMDLVLKRAEEVLRPIVTERLTQAIKLQLSSTETIVDLAILRVFDLVRSSVSSCEVGQVVTVQTPAPEPASAEDRSAGYAPRQPRTDDLSERLRPLGDALRNDIDFRAAIINHAGSLIKSNLKVPDIKDVETACEALLNSKGFIEPTRRRLQHHLALLLPEDHEVRERIIESASDFQLFNADFVDVVRRMASTVLDLQGADLIATFVKRLKNDASLRALIRKLENASPASMYAED